jgi:hypothetical protein
VFFNTVVQKSPFSVDQNFFQLCSVDQNFL